MRSNRRNTRGEEERASPEMEVAGHSMRPSSPGSPVYAFASGEVHRELVETDAVARDVEAELRFQGDQVRANRERVEAMRAQLRKFQQITADNTKEINSLRAKRFRLVQAGEESPVGRASTEAGAAATEMHEEDEMRRRFRSHANEVPHMDLEDEDQRSESSAQEHARSSLYPPSDADSDVDSVTGREGLMESATLNEDYEEAFLEIKSYVGSIFAPQSMSSWNELPTDTLALDFVHGYSAHGRSNNVFWLASRELVFTCGSIAVVASMDSLLDSSIPRRQRFFTKHENEIGSLCVHPDGMMVATGEDAAEPRILVWASDSEGMELAGPPLQDHHRRGISAMAFSKDGRWLLSCGYDAMNTVLLHDWKSGEVLCSEAAGPSRVLAARCNPHDGTFVTVGAHHIKFWSVAVVLGAEESAQMTVWQKRLQGKKGIFGRHGSGRSKTLLAVEFAGPGVTVTGARDGTLMVWKGAMLTAWLQAHQGPVMALWAVMGEGAALLCSGGKDGAVGLWVFDSNLRAYAPPMALGQGCIRALCWHDTMNALAVGTAEGAILYVPVREDGGAAWQRVVRGHSRGRVEALAVHPKLPLYLSGSRAGSLLLWDAERRCLLAECALQRGVTALAFSPDGTRVAAGLESGGGVIVMLSEDRRLKPTAYAFAASLREPISVVRYSPQGDLLAAASGRRVEVLNAQALKSRVGVCSGHTGVVSHLDWASDGSALASVSREGHELFFWDRHSCKARPASGLAELYNPEAEVRWASWTSVLGWPVQGIVARYRDEAEVTCVDRDAGGSLIAAGDAHGKVSLFRYPCSSAAAQCHSLGVHVGPVAQVAFVKVGEGLALVSCGLADQGVLQWALVPASGSVAAGRVVREAEARQAQGVDPDLQQVLQGLLGEEEREEVAVEEEADEFDSVKPYLVSVCPPSAAAAAEEGAQGLPPWELSLEHVHGTFGARVRGNVRCLRSGEVVFGAGRMCIVQGYGSSVAADGSHAAVPRSQRFFSHHGGHVQAVTCHPDGALVASAERGSPGMVLVWNADDMELVARLENNTRGVSALAFSSDGRFLATVSNGEGRTVSVWDWESEALVAREEGDKVEKHKILAVRFNPETSSGEYAFVTAGVRHIRFWTLQQDRLRSRKGVANGVTQTPTHTCVGFGYKTVSITGTDDGELWIWRDHLLSQRIQAHQGPVFDIANSDTGNHFCSAGKDGILKVRNLDLVLVDSVNLVEHALAQRVTDILISSVSESLCCIRSVDWSMDKIVVGTGTCDIFEISYAVTDTEGENRITRVSDGLGVAVLQHAHNSGHIRAVSTHPQRQMAATGGDDGTIRFWECGDRFLLVGIVAADAVICSLDFSPVDGNMLAVGFMEGDVKFIETSGVTGKVHMNNILIGSSIARRKQDTVYCLKFSPQGRYLAVGSRTGLIDVYSTADFAPVTTCKGHTGCVTALDWDVDGQYLQSNSTNDELMFWEIPSGFQIRRVADVRDTAWASWSLHLGWPVLGALPPGSESSILALQRQATKPHAMFATGDKAGLIKLFNFPCPKRDNRFISYSSKMSAINGMGFTFDDSYLIAVSGPDSAVLIYKMVKLEDIPVTTRDIELILEKPLSAGVSLDLAEHEAHAPTFSSIKPYLGALFSPTHKMYGDVPPQVSDSKLKLKYMHAYRGMDCRHNIFFLASGEFAYLALGIVVIHSPLENTRSQRFFCQHDGDVISLAVHPDGKTIASSDKSRTPTILVWDSETLKVKCKLALFQYDGRWVSDVNGVSSLAFGGKGGRILATVGSSSDNVVSAIDWGSSSLIASSVSGCSKVVAVACNPKDGTIVTCGVSHLQFWTVRKTRIQAADAVFGGLAVSRTMQSVDFIVHGDFNFTLTGSIDGSIFCWQGSRLLRFFEAHTGPIFEVLVTSTSSLLTAGEDGIVRFWNIDEVSAKLQQDETNEPISILPEGNELILTAPSRFDKCIRSVARHDDDILIGTAHNEILHIGLKSQHARQARTFIAGHGHTATLSVIQHPKRATVFFSLGQDSCLRAWDGPRSSLLLVFDVEEHVTALPTCMHVSQNGETLVIGFEDGQILILNVHCSDDSSIQIQPLPFDSASRSYQRGRAVTVVKLSTEDEASFLAVGADDGVIDVYLVRESAPLEYAGSGRGHQGAVSQIDWSFNGRVLQSCSAAYEFLFWDFEFDMNANAGRAKGRCKEARAVVCRDAEFPDWTCPFGWPVQDIQLHVSDENQIAAVHASPEARVCVVGDKLGRVSMFVFPSVEGNKPFQDVRVHPCGVSCIHMANRAVLSGSAIGGGVLQWSVDSQGLSKSDGKRQEPLRDSCVRAILQKAPGGEKGLKEPAKSRKDAKEGEDDRFFDSFHPYVAAIKSPEGWKSSQQSNESPDNELRLEYALGYSGMDHSSNLLLMRSGEILYHTARLCIVANFTNNRRTQRIFHLHERDVSCMTMHPKGEIVASADAGEYPTILIWNALSLRCIQTIRAPTSGPILLLCFSADGKVVAAVSRDSATRLSFSDWSNDMLMAESKPEQSGVLAFRCNPITGTFVTCGVNHMAFWRLLGRNLSKQSGIVANKEALTCIAFVGTSEHDSMTITGSELGKVYLWTEDADALTSRNPLTIMEAHEQPILDLFADKEGLVTCDKGGHVHIWEVGRKAISKSSTIVLDGSHSQQTCFHCGSVVCVRAICRARGEQGSVLMVGMGNNSICEVAGTKLTVLTQGHGRGNITALSSHPGKPYFATAGEDRMIILWSREQRIATASVRVEHEPTALAFSQDGVWIAVGFATGGLSLLRAKSMDVMTLPERSQTPKKAINALRYSPDGRYLATASADAMVFVYALKMKLHEDAQSINLEVLGKCRGHAGSVLNLDWSVDSSRIQSESDAYDTIVWDVTAVHDKQILPVRNAQDHSSMEWATRTCILTWHTSGLVHPGADMNSIRSASRSNLGDVLSVGDSDGAIRLYRFPCLDQASKCRMYHGHRQNVSKVAFSYDDRHLVSVGSKDQTIVIWQHLVIPGAEGTDLAVKALLKIDQVHLKNKQVSAAGKDEDFDDIHPFVSSMFPPTSWPAVEPSETARPSEKLQLEYVHGFKGQSNHGNLLVLSTSELVYLAAAVVVVFNVESKTQRHFREHGHEILCLSLHPVEDIVASADAGPHGTILIWKASSFQVLFQSRGIHHSVVSCLCFSLDGTKLITANMDHDHTLCLFEWKTKKRLALERSGNHQVVAVACHPDGESFVSCGVKHVQFWVERRGHLQCRNGSFGEGRPQTMLAIGFCGADEKNCYTITAAQNGCLYVWKDSAIHRIIVAHRGPVFDMEVTEDGVVTGGSDGLVKMWDEDWTCCLRLDVSELTYGMSGHIQGKEMSVCSVAAGSTDALGTRRVLVGLQSNELFEFCFNGNPQEVDVLPSSRLVVQSHASANILAVATHPTQQVFATVGDDRMLRTWDCSGCHALACTGVDAHPLAVAYSASGQEIYVGLNTGAVVSTNDTLMDEFMTVIDKRKAAITCLRISPTGRFLAVGCEVGYIDIFDFNAAQLHCSCKGASGSVLHMDWSSDERLLQANTDALELMFFDVEHGHQVTRSTDFRDKEWATWTCTFGWMVKGLSTHATELVAAVRESSSLLAAGLQSGEILLTGFPCLGDAADCERERGHLGLRDLAFTTGGRHVISVGAVDCSILQWSIQEPEPSPVEQDEDELFEEFEQVQSSELMADSSVLILKRKLDTGDPELHHRFISKLASVMRVRADKISIQPIFGDDKAVRVSFSATSLREALRLLDDDFNSLQGRLRKELFVSAIIANDEVYRIVRRRRANQSKAAVPPVADAASELCTDPALLKPYISNLIEPTHFQSAGESREPDEGLELEYVYGFNGANSIGSVCYLRSFEILYTAATIAIVQERSEDSNGQYLFRSHSHEIVSLALHPEREIVSTGDNGPKNQIFVWSSSTLEILSQFPASGPIRCLCFSRNGDKIAVIVENAEESCLEVYDWKSKRRIVEEKADKHTILGIRYNPFDEKKEDVWVTFGVSHLKVWTLRGTLMSSRAWTGEVNSKARLQPFLCVAVPRKAMLLSGTHRGEIYVFKITPAGPKFDGLVHGHDGPVYDLWASETLVLSCGQDGLVHRWSMDGDMRPSKSRPPLLTKTKSSSRIKSSLRSVSFRETAAQTTVLVATSTNEIYEIDEKSNKWQLLTQGHSEGAVVAMCADPVNTERFLTGGEDGTVRVWDCGDHRCVHLREFHSPVLCADYTPDAKTVALGTKDGNLLLLQASLEDSSQTELARKAGSTILAVKFDPNMRYLAIARQNNTLEILSVENKCARVTVFRGLSSAVCEIDWDTEGRILRTTTKALELLFWDLKANAAVYKIADLRDREWHTHNCTLGWYSKGALAAVSHESMLSSIDHQTSLPVLAVGELSGDVRLYRFPCTASGAGSKSFTGHLPGVACVRFDRESGRLFTSGNADASILQWKVFKTTWDPVVKAIMDKGIPYVPSAHAVPPMGMPSTAADQVPSTSPAVKPQNHVVLEHVHGFRGHDSHQSIKALGSGEIVYNAATLCVVLDSRSNHQSFFEQHDADVVSIALHPQLSIVATGDCAPSPVVYVWDSETMRSLARFDSASVGFQGPITALCFSPDGRQLVVATNSAEHDLFVLSWESKSVDLIAPSGRGHVFSCAFQPSGTFFVTCGSDHVRFWIDKGGRPAPKVALFGKQWAPRTMLCVAFCSAHFVQHANKKEIALTGGVDGKVYAFGAIAGGDWRCELLNSAFEAHRGPVFDICVTADTRAEQFLTTGKDGRVKLWKMTSSMDSKDKSKTVLGLQILKEWDLSATVASIPAMKTEDISPDSSMVHGKSLCLQDRNLIVGTDSNEIVQLDFSAGAHGELVTAGHRDGGINGVCCDTAKPFFVTIGEDGFLRLWNIESRALHAQQRLECSGTAVDLSSDGRFAAAGLQNGKVVVKKVFHEPYAGGSHFEPIAELEPPRTSCRITAVRFSSAPGATFLAVGCENSVIHVFQHLPNDEFAFLDSAKPDLGVGHKGKIVSLNWSVSANYLASTCDQNIVMVWFWGGAANPTLRHDQSADSLKENPWSTWSSPVGWPSAGLGSSVEIGETVCEVTRSRSTQHAPVLGGLESTGNLLLTPYPFPEASLEALLSFSGHSRDPNGLAFAADDSHVLSVGGPDRAVLQWRHSHAPLLPDPPVLQIAVSTSEYQVAKRRVRPKLKPPAIAYKAPTSWPSKLPVQETEPEHTLVFEHAYGYRGSDWHGGVQFFRTANDEHNNKWNGEFLYVTGGRSIIHDSRMNTQRILQEEMSMIVCQAVSIDGIRIATAGGRDSPHLYVWRARDGLVLKRLHGHHDEGYSAVCFSVANECSRLFCVGSDSRYQVAVYDWMQRSSNPKPLAVRSGGPDPIVGVKCRLVAQKDQFVTFGRKHLRFWTVEEVEGTTRLQSTRAVFQKHRTDHTFLAIAFHENLTFAGTAEGTIFVLHYTTVTSVIESDRSHSMAVLDMDTLNNYVVTGGLDGNIKFWHIRGHDLELKKTLPLQQIETGARGIHEARGRDRGSEDYTAQFVGGCAHLSKITKETGKAGVSSCKLAKVLSENGIDMEVHLLVGTTFNEIFLASSIAQDDVSAFGDSGFVSTLLAQGHFRAVHAVAPHPNKPMFATGAHDGTVRVHDAEDRVLLAMGYYTDGQILSLEWAPRENVDRHALAAGTSRGGICVFTYTTAKVSLEVTHVIKPVDPKRGVVNVVRFSPDSQMLAAGTRCGHIDVYGCLTGYTWIGSCQPLEEESDGSPEICAMDWSSDSNTIQSMDLSGRHVLWDMTVRESPALFPPKRLATGRDETWYTFSVLAGWPVDAVVQGKHGNPAALDCVSHVDGVGGVHLLKGNAKCPNLAVTAVESGFLRMFRFPARSDSKHQNCFRAFHNGTRMVSGAMFSTDGSRVFSVSGDDMTVVQWAVVHQDEVGESGQVIRAHRAAEDKISLSDRENFWKISNADLEALEQRRVRMDLNIIEPKTESLKRQRMYVIDFTFDKVQLVILGREGKEAPAEGSKIPTLPVSSQATWKEVLLMLATFFGMRGRNGELQSFTFMYEKFFISAERQEVCESRMRQLFPRYQDADIAALKHRTRRSYTVRNEQDFRQCWHWIEQEYRWLLSKPQSKLPDGQVFELPVYAIPFSVKRRVPGPGEAGAEEVQDEQSDRDSDVETLVASGDRENPKVDEEDQSEKAKATELVDPEGYLPPTDLEGVPPEIAAPNVTFELESVHGYNGRGSHRNVFFLKTGEVLYPAGSLGIRFDRHGNHQKIFGRHTGIIASMALHSDGETVATGEQGSTPTICVWNTFTNTLLQKFVGEHKHKVSALAFSTSSASSENLLVSLGGKEPQTIAVYDWKDGKVVLTQEAPSEKIVAVACNPHYSELKFISVGIRHVRFWERQRKRLDVTRGSYQVQCDSKTMLSVSFTDARDIALTGSKDGNIVIWKESKAVQKVDCLKGPIFDICMQGDSVVVGGKDELRPIQMLKTSKSWPEVPSLQKVNSALNDGLTLEQGQSRICVRALAWKGNEVVVGTSLNCMHWVGIKPLQSREVPVKTSVRGHARGRVASIAVHPTKPIFVSVGDDGFVRMYDLEQRTPAQFRNLGEPLTAVAISPKESRIAVGYRSGELRIVHDVDLNDVTGLEREYGYKRCEVHITYRKNAAVNALRYHPDGHLLALAAEDRIIDLYDVVNNYRHVRCLEASPGGHTGPVTGLDFGELEGTFLQSCSSTTEVRYWQIACDGEQVHGQLVSQQRARDAAWFTWSLPAGWPVQGVSQSLGATCVVSRSPPVVPGSASSAEETEHARYILAAGGADGRVALLAYPCLSVQTRYRTSAACHAGAVSGVAFSERGNRVISCGAGDLTVMVWKVTHRERGAEIAGDEGRADEAERSRARNLCALVALSPAVDRVSAVLSDTKITVWSFADSQTKKVSTVTGPDWQTVNACSFNPSGTLVCSGSVDHMVRVSEVVEGGRQAGPDQSWKLEGHEDEVTACVFSPNGKRIASGSLDKTARVWDASAVAPEKCLGIGRGHRKGILCVAWSDDGKRICSGSMDNSLLVYEVRGDLDEKGGKQSLELKGRMRGHKTMVVCCAFSPGAINSHRVRVCSGSFDKTVVVWDLESGAELHRLEHQEKLLGCAFSVCGHFVGAACLDNSVTLWDVSADNAEQVERHESSASSAVNVMGAAFTEKGELLAFLCRDPERAAVDATLFLPPPGNKTA